MAKKSAGDKPFKTTEKQHPLLAGVVAALDEQGKVFSFKSDQLGRLTEAVKAVDHPAEAWMLAEDLISLAYFLDHEKKSPQAAGAVLDLATILLPTLNAVTEAFKKGADINWDKAKKIVATEQSNRPAAAAEGGAAGKNSLFSLRTGRNK
jgi:hypothetical protein